MVLPRDSNALADAIIKLLNEKRARVSMKEEIKKKYREGECSGENIARETIRVYEKAIAEN